MVWKEEENTNTSILNVSVIVLVRNNFLDGDLPNEVSPRTILFVMLCRPELL